MYLFEDKIEEIEELLSKSRNHWHLDAVPSMDYDDVCQIIRRHIYEKWHLWDQKRNFGPWCRTVIRNQIRNELRNNYGRFAKPCLGCPHYVSEDECAFTKSKKQDSSCDLYAEWEKKKKRIHDVKLPLSMENRVINNSTDLYNELNYKKSSDNLHEKVLKKIPNSQQKKIYSLLYVEGKSDQEVAEEMNFKPESGRKNARYKQIENLKARFISLAKQVLETDDVIEG